MEKTTTDLYLDWIHYWFAHPILAVTIIAIGIGLSFIRKR
jgi:hypothetical protein